MTDRDDGKCPEMGIYKRKILGRKERKHAFDQGKKMTKENKLDQVKKQVIRSYFFSFINSHLGCPDSALHIEYPKRNVYLCFC